MHCDRASGSDGTLAGADHHATALGPARVTGNQAQPATMGRVAAAGTGACTDHDGTAAAAFTLAVGGRRAAPAHEGDAAAGGRGSPSVTALQRHVRALGGGAGADNEVNGPGAGAAASGVSRVHRYVAAGARGRDGARGHTHRARTSALAGPICAAQSDTTRRALAATARRHNGGATMLARGRVAGMEGQATGSAGG